jgi:transposase
MPKKRTPMTKIYDVLRLKFEAKLSNRDVAHCLKIGAATVSDILGRFRNAGLTWPLSDDLKDVVLEARLFPGKACSPHKAQPDFAQIHRELKRKGMTKLLLWQEYQAEYPETAYGYTQFCSHYQRWQKKLKRSMRQQHAAGDKLFIDYCGPTVPIVNPDSGEVRQAQIFVATLGASNYTYVEACEGQDQQSWLMAHVNAFEFFGGVPNLLVPDNLRSAVTKADRYEPTLNENYLKLARHYNTAVMPARPYKPRDKAKAENAVLIVERWILMRIRHQSFHTLASLNQTLRELLDDLNQRAFRHLPGNRQSLFGQLDKPALKPLPGHRYEYLDHHHAKVGIDYHILYKKHAYSVPHRYVGERVDIQASARLVRVYFKGTCIAQHPRHHRDGGFTTEPGHMPTSHQKQRWSPEQLLNWGNSIGPGARTVVESELGSKAHPEQAYRCCLGLLNLQRTYGDARLEQACQSAILLERPTRRTVVNLLKNNREDPARLQPTSPEEPSVSHSNIRGAGYYN